MVFGLNHCSSSTPLPLPFSLSLFVSTQTIIPTAPTNLSVHPTEESARLKTQAAEAEAQDQGPGVAKFSMDDGETAAAAADGETSTSVIKVWQRVRVEADTTGPPDIWALLEFETINLDAPDVVPPKRYKKWQKFDTESALQDYIRRDTGEPLTVPPFSLSPEQSLQIEEESKKSVSQVTEEFRRFRVRAEVQRKQTDAQIRDLHSSNVETATRRIEGEDLVRVCRTMIPTDVCGCVSICKPCVFNAQCVSSQLLYTFHTHTHTQEKELEQARTSQVQLERLKSEMVAQEAQWKEAYDVLLAENSALKSSGSEALLAAQWRQRYENCLTEKEDLASRLQMEVEKAAEAEGQRRTIDAGKYEMKYRDLKESFRLYRKKAKEIFEAQQRGDVAVSTRPALCHSSETVWRVTSCWDDVSSSPTHSLTSCLLLPCFWNRPPPFPCFASFEYSFPFSY